MKKTLVALAIAGAFTGAAFAQSSVTLYGIADVNFQVNDPDRGGLSTTTGVNSGQRNGSRWGLRGLEDLGGGLKARFQLEGGYQVDTGTINQGGRLWGRQAYVGLQGDFGLLALGRFATIGSGTGAFDVFSDIDPFYTGYGTASLASTFSETGSLRVDNSVLYQTPNISGFQAAYIHSFNFNGGEAAGNSNNTRVDSLGVSFGAGPFYGAVTYNIAKFPTATAFKDQKMLQIGATYDLKVVKLHAAYDNETAARSQLISAVSGADGTDAKAWMLGVSVPFGPLASKFMASYQNRDGKNQTIGATNYNADRKVWGVGYEYMFSKRTYVHAVYADTSGSNTLKVGSAATDFANAKQYTVGITHFF
jgi:general bacterial porin, GBP family